MSPRAVADSRIAINCLAMPLFGLPTRRMRPSSSSSASGMSEKSISESGICLTLLAARLSGTDDADRFFFMHSPTEPGPWRPCLGWCATWNERSKIQEAIAWSLKNDDGNIELREILLKSKIAVDGHKRVKLLLGQSEQVAVLDTCPTHLRNGQDFVSSDLLCKSAVDAFVLQNSREATGSIRAFASSRKAITCSRVTVGKPSRKSSIVSPPSK